MLELDEKQLTRKTVTINWTTAPRNESNKKFKNGNGNAERRRGYVHLQVVLGVHPRILMFLRTIFRPSVRAAKLCTRLRNATAQSQQPPEHSEHNSSRIACLLTCLHIAGQSFGENGKTNLHVRILDLSKQEQTVQKMFITEWFVML